MFDDSLQTNADRLKRLLETCDSLVILNEISVSALGKKGFITVAMKSLREVPAEQRHIVGAQVNNLKKEIQTLIKNKKKLLETLELGNLNNSDIDTSLPGRKNSIGTLHLISQTIKRIEDIFTRIGFEVQEGPEIESDWYNFAALNFSENHPARDMHDTFYFANGNLLRTHTSSVQIRTLEQSVPPVRIIAPGKVYRCDSDQTHTPMFHQVEGLVVDKSANFSELIGLLTSFLKSFFADENLEVRFRPSFFPFTEPSAEVDIRTHLIKSNSWLEILGCGMVHPNVLEKLNLEPRVYSGYAFGLGVERLAMLRYGIDDLRIFFENDIRFLKQFPT